MCVPGPGVYSFIRRTASEAIRNHAWAPSGSSSAPNQKVCSFGSMQGSRGVRVRGPPGQSSARPLDGRSAVRRRSCSSGRRSLGLVGAPLERPRTRPVIEEAPLVSALELWIQIIRTAGPGPCQCVVGWPAKCRAAAQTATRRAQHSWGFATKCQTHHRTLQGSTTATPSTCAPGTRLSPVRAVPVRSAASNPPSKRTTGPSSTRLRTPRRPTT